MAIQLNAAAPIAPVAEAAAPVKSNWIVDQHTRAVNYISENLCVSYSKWTGLTEEETATWTAQKVGKIALNVILALPLLLLAGCAALANKLSAYCCCKKEATAPVEQNAPNEEAQEVIPADDPVVEQVADGQPAADGNV